MSSTTDYETTTEEFLCSDCGASVEADDLLEFEIYGERTFTRDEIVASLKNTADDYRARFARYIATAIEAGHDAETYSNMYRWMIDGAERVESLLASGSDDELLHEARRTNVIMRAVTDTVSVCADHVMHCQFCEEPYITTPQDLQPAPYTNWRSPWVMGETQWLTWLFDDTVCYKCSDDAMDCSACGEIIHRDHAYYLDYSDTYYCEACYAEETYECDYCNERVNSGHDEDYCRQENESEELINNYSYRPEPVFHEAGKDPSYRPYDNHTPYMGFELEVELSTGDRYSSATDVQEILGSRAYLKSDGSINYGYEIVTHPHNLEAYASKEFPWSFLDYLSQNGGSSWRTSTCGLHVHVSRAAFGSLVHQALFTHLIQSNKAQMERLAGRTGSTWAKFGEGDAPVSKKVKGQAWDRYQAVNMTNRNTVEVRIFRGSLMKRRILMALELVNAVFEYTRPMATNDYIKGNLSWDAFAKWCKTRKEYENLNYYIRLYRLYDNHTANN